MEFVDAREAGEGKSRRKNEEVYLSKSHVGSEVSCTRSGSPHRPPCGAHEQPWGVAGELADEAWEDERRGGKGQENCAGSGEGVLELFGACVRYLNSI